MNKYFFITGRQPELSRAELYSRFNLLGINFQFVSKDPQTIVFNLPNDIDALGLIDQLGGTIKIGRVVFETNYRQLEQDLLYKNHLSKLFNLPGRLIFGISLYSNHRDSNQIDIKKLGLTIKSVLKDQGRSARFITSQTNPLSSVIVAKNKLIQRGSEIVLIDTGLDKLLVGQTLAVQKFEDYSQRDYGRPERNMKQGMLPPKLAKMLVNLAQATTNSLIIDPFCGSGTVLQEARLLGYKNLFGSDNNPRAIEDSKNNLTWLKRKYNLIDSSVVLKRLDVRNLTKYIPESYPKAIITEPYLGPTRLPNNKSALERIYQEITSLFLGSFRVFSQILKTDERVVIVFPLWKFNYNAYRLSILPQIKKMGFDLTPYPDWVGSPPFLYHRPDQFVWREIYIFKKGLPEK